MLTKLERAHDWYLGRWRNVKSFRFWRCLSCSYEQALAQSMEAETWDPTAPDKARPVARLFWLVARNFHVAERQYLKIYRSVGGALHAGFGAVFFIQFAGQRTVLFDLVLSDQVAPEQESQESRFLIHLRETKSDKEPFQVVEDLKQVARRAVRHLQQGSAVVSTSALVAPTA